MKMQKRIFTVIISKLVFFRLYSFSHFIFYRDTSSTAKFLACLFQRAGWGSHKRTRHLILAYSDQHQESDYLREEENQWRIVSSNAPRDSMLRVGVLDDNPAILGLIETVLTMDGHIACTHTSGSSLLDALFSEEAEELSPYDLVILDLLLPGTQSGVDVFFAIRQRFSTEMLPIIVITAVDEPTLKQFRHILPDDVPLLRKPFAPRKFRQLIAQLTGDMASKK
jgi:CheY-like chemotaxis protein